MHESELDTDGYMMLKYGGRVPGCAPRTRVFAIGKDKQYTHLVWVRFLGGNKWFKLNFKANDIIKKWSYMPSAGEIRAVRKQFHDAYHDNNKTKIHSERMFQRP